jgi:hypothetical protein
MKKYRLSLIVLTVVMLLSLVMVGPARSLGLTEISPAAIYPWRIAMFGDFNVMKNPSTAFGSINQTPVITFTKGETTIGVGMPAPDGVGNCGPMVNFVRTWDCTDYYFGELAVSLAEISPVTTYPTVNGFITGWTIIDKAPLSIILFVEEWGPSGGRIDFAETPLLALTTGSPFEGFTVKGSTSLAFDSAGEPHAAVILDKTATGEDYLVYIHPGESDGSCGFSNFRCEIITIKSSLGIDPTPILKLTAEDSPRITFLDAVDVSAMFGYPEDDPLLNPNCGPGGDTWHCVEIAREDLTDSVGDKPSMALGLHAQYVAYVLEDLDETKKALWMAEFVGSGGDCGWDTYLDGNLEVQQGFRWQCGLVQWIDTSPILINTAFSIQVDPLDYPVIAFSYQPASSSEQCMDVTYPAERAGGTPGTWRRDFITCTDPIFDELALSESGLGFIGYVDKTIKNVLLAIQDYLLYLPAIVR